MSKNRAARRAAAARQKKRENRKAGLSLSIGGLEKTLELLQTNFAEGIDRYLEFMVDQAIDSTYGETKDTRVIAGRVLEHALTDDVRRVLLRRQWRGATPENIDDTLANAVAERIDAKQGLLLLLAAVDQYACTVVDVPRFATVPDADVQEHVRTYYPDLLRGPEEGPSEEICTLMIKLRWRGATPNTVDHVFADAIAARALEFRKHGKRGVVQEDFAKRLPAREQKANEDHFRQRLVREFRAYNERTAKTEALFAPFEDEDEDNKRFNKNIERLTSLKDKYDPEKDIRTVEKAHPQVAQAMRDLDTRVSGLIDQRTRELAAAETTKLVGQASSAHLFTKAFDQDVMRFGVRAWEETYRQGMDDVAARAWVHQYVATIGRDAKGQASFEPILAFAALWAVHAFQKVTTSHTFAAALMCSDANREALETIEVNWRAFLVVVPNGMLTAPGAEYTRILVAAYTDRADLLLFDPHQSDKALVGIGERAATLADLLLDTKDETRADRTLVMAKRLVAGLLLSLQHPDNFRDRHVPHRAGRPGRQEEEPAHRVVFVGKPLSIDCRASVANYIQNGTASKKSRKHAPPSMQTLVRGHYKRQVFGTGRLGRKVVWISPFWRGPEDAPILTRPKNVAGKSHS